jgi:D-aminopeptidase
MSRSRSGRRTRDRQSDPAPNPRARDLGIPFDGKPGTHNSITDVPGVRVGHCTHLDGAGPLQIGKGPRNTGVTAILPRGNDESNDGDGIDTTVMAGWFSLNGNGEMTGTHLIEESGFLEGPIMITNTVSVGTVRDGVINYRINQLGGPGAQIDPDEFLYLPLVAETSDEWLNDILGFHVTQADVQQAIDGANPIPNQRVQIFTEEGNVGGGAGMTCYDWKGGIGTSSRIVEIGKLSYTVGVLVQANQGEYPDLVIRGVPVGTEMVPPSHPEDSTRRRLKSSIIVVIATDAPMLPTQLKRLARRAAHGVARTGTYTNNDSGELFVAFSTVDADDYVSKEGLVSLSTVQNYDLMDPFFKATADATEQAIINALVAATSLVGRDNHKAWGITDPKLPGKTLLQVMKDFNRLEKTSLP